MASSHGDFFLILPSMSKTSNRMEPSKISDQYHACFQN